MSRSVANTFGRMHRHSLEDTAHVEWPDPKQLIGIEIECELSSRTVLPAHPVGWTRDNDGSLIRGVEYKLSSPMSGSNLAGAIASIFSGNTKLARSVTSGTHIHINMDEETTHLSGMQAVAALVYVIEPAIFALSDPGRKWGGFTNPLDTAPSDLFRALFDPKLEEDPQYLLDVCSSNRAYKYFGLNMQTLGSYGTFEFRYFPTATSADELIDWVSLVQAIKLTGLASPSMEVLLDTMSDEDGYTSTLNIYMSRWAERIIKAVPAKTARRRVKELRIRAESSVAGLDHVTSTRHGSIASNPKLKKFFKVTKVKEQPSFDRPYGEDEVPTPRSWVLTTSPRVTIFRGRGGPPQTSVPPNVGDACVCTNNETGRGLWYIYVFTPRYGWEQVFLYGDGPRQGAIISSALARNMWPYMPIYYQQMLSMESTQRLPEGLAELFRRSCPR